MKRLRPGTLVTPADVGLTLFATPISNDNVDDPCGRLLPGAVGIVIDLVGDDTLLLAPAAAGWVLANELEVL